MQVLALLAALVLASPAPPSPRVARAGPAPRELREFEAGQVWSYRTRPGEARSRVLVCRVDAATSAGPIVHVQVAGVAIRNPAADGGVTTIAGHLPLTADALRESVVALEAGGARCAGFEEAHGAWREGLAAGHAGVLHVGLAEALDVLQRAVDRAAARTVERPADGPDAPEPLAMTR